MNLGEENWGKKERKARQERDIERRKRDAMGDRRFWVVYCRCIDVVGKGKVCIGSSGSIYSDGHLTFS